MRSKVHGAALFDHFEFAIDIVNKNTEIVDDEANVAIASISE